LTGWDRARLLSLVQLQYEITPAEHLEKVKVVRPLLVNPFLDGFGLLAGVITYLYFDKTFGMLLTSVFAALLILQILLPFVIHRRFYSRNPSLFGMRTVTFDDDGVKSDSQIAHIEIKWSSFVKFKETKNLFLLYQTRDVVGITPKRAFPSPDAVEQFRNLLASKLRRD